LVSAKKSKTYGGKQKVPKNVLTNFILLPELNLERIVRIRKMHSLYHCSKSKTVEYCPKCATASKTTYDHRKVRLEDAPIRGYGVSLVIKKRRLWCKNCEKPFTEPLRGVLPGKRTTQRFRKSVAIACRNFSDLKRVKHEFKCSNDFIYTCFYEYLELQRRMNNQYAWPETLGIDEHNFRRVRGRHGYRQFVTMMVDYKNKKLFELAPTKTNNDLQEYLRAIPGRGNVKKAIIDMCDPYKNFITEFFPNAEIIADKFHVLRLINPHMLRLRKEITGDKRKHPIRFLLQRSGRNLEFYERSALYKWLEDYPELAETYAWKERLYGFYRIKGYERAKRAFTQMTDQMAKSKLKHIQSFRKTLMKWRIPILNYFKFRLTNARTEGYNNVAKVIKRRSYGFRSFKNYRLRLLYACS